MVRGQVTGGGRGRGIRGDAITAHNVGPFHRATRRTEKH